MNNSPLRDLELLLRARHPLIVLDSEEEDRASGLLELVVDRASVMYFKWSAAYGLKRSSEPQPVYATTKLDACLEHIASSGAAGAVYHLAGAVELFDDPDRSAKLLALCEPLMRVGSSVILTGPCTKLPERVQKLATRVALEPPTDNEYYQFVNAILADVRKRLPVSMELSAHESAQLIAHLRGLTFFEVRKVMTQALLNDGKLSSDDLAFVLAQKREIVEQSGVLEYFAAETKLDDIAGLARLKHWLDVRAPVFEDPTAAAEFGLSAPKGLLLLGVQGCGKSMCAKAVAQAWSLPLLRLDPARIYNKYLGESERNLKKAIALAERLAPIVLWIDEIEKVFGPAQGEDSGAAQRIFGSFLTWLQEKRDSVFVIATSNNITHLPPELLRKGRFDEIFFVDLPDATNRAHILALHLTRRRRVAAHFDLDALAAQTEGFSGAELEQVVVAGLYSAFAERVELEQRHLFEEIARTRPLSVTMSEPIASLRAWARTRTTPAD